MKDLCSKKTLDAYRGVHPPKCCGGEGCKACWAKHAAKREQLASEAKAWSDGTNTLEGWEDAPDAIPRSRMSDTELCDEYARNHDCTALWGEITKRGLHLDPDAANNPYVTGPLRDQWRHPEQWRSPVWQAKMRLSSARAARRRREYGFIKCPECGVGHTNYTLTCRECGHKALQDD